MQTKISVSIKGRCYENIVGEALSKCGYGLYYYKREDSTLEEDFFVRNAAILMPVEVKAKRETAKSLRTLIESDEFNRNPVRIEVHGWECGS